MAAIPVSIPGADGADEENFVCKAHQNTSLVASVVEEDAGEFKQPAQEQGALISRFPF